MRKLQLSFFIDFGVNFCFVEPFIAVFLNIAFQSNYDLLVLLSCKIMSICSLKLRSPSLINPKYLYVYDFHFSIINSKIKIIYTYKIYKHADIYNNVCVRSGARFFRARFFHATQKETKILVTNLIFQ